MSGAERRGETRFITILPLSILDEKGQPVDDAATAHDLTPGGFKGECQAELKEGQLFGFSLDLPDGKPPVKGKAQAVWVKKHDFATWVGGKIVSMGWSDKRRLKAVLAPPGIEWGPIVDHALSALVWIVVAMFIHRVFFERALWRRTLAELWPTFIAVGVAGWALLSFVRRR
jgi:hypothetical protein